MTRAVFDVAGWAAPKGSRTFHGRGRSSESSKRCGPWVEQVAYAARATGLKQLAPPYEVELTFYMPQGKKPKYAWPSKDGDLDKLVRACLDGLVKGELILDDRHVTRIVTEKSFGSPHVSIAIT